MGATKTKGKNKRKAIPVSVTVAKFTDRGNPFTIVRNNQSLQEFARCHGGDYRAQGFDTPLRDATCRMIRHLDRLQSPDRVTIGLLADESASMSGRDAGVIEGINDFVSGMADVKKVDKGASGKVLCVIITDGLENASREVSPEVLREMLREREANGWTFIYLGANQDAWDVGTSHGLSGGVTGQTVSMGSSSPQAFRSALGTTGHTHGAAYLSDNQGYGAKMKRAGTSSRVIAEDGTESAAGHGDETGTAPYGDVSEALKRAREATEE